MSFKDVIINVRNCIKVSCVISSPCWPGGLIATCSIYSIRESNLNLSCENVQQGYSLNSRKQETHYTGTCKTHQSHFPHQSWFRICSLFIPYKLQIFSNIMRFPNYVTIYSVPKTTYKVICHSDKAKQTQAIYIYIYIDP